MFLHMDKRYAYDYDVLHVENKMHVAYLLPWISIQDLLMKIGIRLYSTTYSIIKVNEGPSMSPVWLHLLECSVFCA